MTPEQQRAAERAEEAFRRAIERCDALLAWLEAELVKIRGGK